MTTVELLMAADVEKLTERPTATLEVKSLSKKLGEPFVVTVKALGSKKFMELSSIALKDNNTADMSKMPDAQALLIVEGMVEPNLRDKDLQEHFGVKTPKDLAFKIFGGGDLAAIADYITELSGYGESSVLEIKN
jgi:hypothetical protein